VGKGHGLVLRQQTCSHHAHLPQTQALHQGVEDPERRIITYRTTCYLYTR
jgi:hypothetical protein